MNVLRKILNVPPLYFNNISWISTTPNVFLKEIVETKEGKKLIIEGKPSASPREPFLLKIESDSGACPVCRTNLDIKHTDVLILSQFVRSNGTMLPRRITGLCKLQQKRIGTMVTMAIKAGLMANRAPPTSKQNPDLRSRWKKCKTYFDETTIKPPRTLNRKKIIPPPF